MGKLRLAQYKDLHPEMKSYIFSHILIGAGIFLVSCVISIVVGSVTPMLIGLLIGAAFDLYYVGVLISCLLGRGDVYEGVVVRTTGNIRGGKLKAAKDVITKKPLKPMITIKTLADQKYLEIPLHQKNTFEKGNKITLFTPSGVVYPKAEDSYYCSSYYKIKLDTVVYGEMEETPDEEDSNG